MENAEVKAVVKNFFETLYERLRAKDEVLVKIPVIEGNEPMWAEGAKPDKDKWVTWRLLPAQISDEEIAELEDQIGAKLPEVLRILLTTYHHYFEDGIGRNPVEEKFEGILNAWNPMLVRNGYLPFAWDEEGYFIRCMDLQNMPDEERCPIVQIDHE
ncbi:MAG: SMI1/KNR4 family protein, partial [Lachnospiraceae bacterium]|nr:SMI1/KNR4 family protein [Lachnospiraceae bacterium]